MVGRVISLVVVLMGALLAGCLGDTQDLGLDETPGSADAEGAPRDDNGTEADPGPDPEPAGDVQQNQSETLTEEPTGPDNGTDQHDAQEAPDWYEGIPTDLGTCTVLELPSLLIEDTVIADGNYCLEAHLEVAPLVELTIRNATVRFNAEPLCLGGGMLSGCTTDLAVHTQSTLRVEDSIVATDRDFSVGPPGWAIGLSRATLHVNGSIFLGGWQLQAGQPGPEPSTVRNSIFVDGREGVRILNGAEAEIVGNRFINMTSGVYVKDSTATVTDNLFALGSYGIDVLASLVNEKTNPISVVIERNRLHDQDHRGIYVRDEHGARVANNTIYGGELAFSFSLPAEALDLEQITPLAEGNVIVGARYGVNVSTVVIVEVPGTELSLDLEAFSFLDIQCTAVSARSNEGIGLEVDATGAWWGSNAGPYDNGPDCPAVDGDAVVYEPWQTR